MENGKLSPEQIGVIGDTYERDLLLPLFKGMTGVLTPRPSTAHFELAAVRNERRGFVAPTLLGAAEYLKQQK